jgi:2,3-bisphosphoglycerate-independent phosphoglycerate mutase
MKYAVLIGDGMADYPIEQLGGKTPLEAARTPNMDFIARHGRLGRITTVPKGMAPGSDVAIISILGYNPLKYYTGRGPLEAANLGIHLQANDVAFRCNLITAGEDTLIDYSAGHISSKEAEILIKSVDKALGTDKIKFYPGVSYRHILVIKDAPFTDLRKIICSPPHDITGKEISKNLPRGDGVELLIKLMHDSRAVLENHEINLVRIDLKEGPANMIWLWGQGSSLEMPRFADKYGLTGSVISAVDLIKGLGRIIGLEVINVPGATGYYDTDYKGKAEAALKQLKSQDFVFLHVEAPDEAGHNGDLREKIAAIERFDQMVVGTLLSACKRKKNFRVMVLPDHATPVSLRTHTGDPVFFGIFGTDILGSGFAGYSEREAKNSELCFENGFELMDYFIKGPQ